jgi:excisionase family DNA binding protein
MEDVMPELTEADHIHSTPEFLMRSLSPRAFARRVGVSPTTVHKWLDEGLPSARIGARRLINIDTADSWLKKKLGINPAATLGENQ